jgi:hypothetical protein
MYTCMHAISAIMLQTTLWTVGTPNTLRGTVSMLAAIDTPSMTVARWNVWNVLSFK